MLYLQYVGMLQLLLPHYQYTIIYLKLRLGVRPHLASENILYLQMNQNTSSGQIFTSLAV